MGISGISTDVTALFGASASSGQLGARQNLGAPAAKGEELTTVTTQCDKKHWHTSACPHTVSTRAADPARGNFIDTYA